MGKGMSRCDKRNDLMHTGNSYFGKKFSFKGDGRMGAVDKFFVNKNDLGLLRRPAAIAIGSIIGLAALALQMHQYEVPAIEHPESYQQAIQHQGEASAGGKKDKKRQD